MLKIGPRPAKWVMPVCIVLGLNITISNKLGKGVNIVALHTIDTPGRKNISTARRVVLTVKALNNAT